MKVLHLNCNYITTALHQTMIEHLDKKENIENHVFVPTYNKKISIINVNQNVYVSECFKKIDRVSFYYKQSKIFKAVTSKYNISSYNIIHAYTLFTDGNCAMKLSKKYGVPYVVAIRDTDVNAFFKYRPYLRNRGIEIMKNASSVFFLSKSYLESVIKKYIPQKLHNEILKKSFVIPNGIDDFWIDNKFYNRKSENILKRINKNKKLKIIFVGQISKRKNIQLILKTIIKLQKMSWNIEFNAIGNNKNKKLLKKLYKDRNFIYLGPKKKEELISYYRNFDIFIMPSKTETFGLVYAEAMSQGLPVIYTSGQGFDGQFEEGKVGFRVKIKNENDIINAIYKICNDYNNISKNCINLVDNFRWNEICNTYMRIYNNILST